LLLSYHFIAHHAASKGEDCRTKKKNGKREIKRRKRGEHERNINITQKEK
jgi:hypothetical protein